jgi:hypothetical protein
MEKYKSHSCPKTAVADAPATAAPAVLAMVLSDSMAAMGRSTFSRILLKIIPPGFPALAMSSICRMGRAYSTASKSEHPADKKTAKLIARISSNIFY